MPQVMNHGVLDETTPPTSKGAEPPFLQEGGRFYIGMC